MAAAQNRRTVRALVKADADYRKARARRRTLMLDAVNDGAPVSDVAKAANVTRDAVYKLVQASRREGR
jgi:transposase